MAGIQNLKEVVLFGCEIVNGIVKSYEDKELNWKDIIIIKGEPLDNISAIKDIKWVIRRGKAFNREEIPGFDE